MHGETVAMPFGATRPPHPARSRQTGVEDERGTMRPQAARAHAGSDAEQRACTPDVFRLCMTAIPDEDAIVACLKSKRTLLSPACADVFNDPPPTRGRRGE